MKSRKRVLLLAVLLLAALQTGCSGIYQGLQTSQEMECGKRPGADQAECSRQSGMSYDEYQRQLKELETKR